MKAVKDIWNKVYENMKRNTYRPDETELKIEKSETTRIQESSEWEYSPKSPEMPKGPKSIEVRDAP